MEKILITGAAGFIGSHLVEHMVKNGYDVVAFDRYNPNNHWGWLENSEVVNDIEVILGDIRDYDSVYKAMVNCEAVLHLAALIGIPYSYISPLAYIKTNIEGTYNVLESAKNLNLSNILIASTSETYGSAQYVPIDENHPLVGQSPYAASKIAADNLGLSYYSSFELPVKIFRPFNTYGPRQSARAIIPTIISQLFQNEKEVSLGNITPTRDLTFVIDTCCAIEEIYRSKDLFGSIINIGMNKEISMEELFNKIKTLMNVDAKISIDAIRERPSKSEVDRLRCDNTKLIKHTTWRPLFNLNNGLKETINWVQHNIHLIKQNLYNV